MITASFTTIRYVPDLFRKEFLNIGVLAIFPTLDFIGFNTVVRKSVLQSFEPSFDPLDISHFTQQLSLLVEKKTIPIYDKVRGSFNDIRLSTVEGLHELGRVYQGSKIQFSEIFEVEFDVEEMSIDIAKRFIDDMTSRYVKKNRVTTASSIRGKAFKTKITQELRQWEKEKVSRNPSDISVHKVIVDYPHQIINMKYDFAYQNGALWLFEALDLSKLKSDSPIDSKNPIFKATGSIYLKFGMAKTYHGVKNTRCNTVTLVNSIPETEEIMHNEIEQLKEKSEVLFLRKPTEKKEFLRMVGNY